MTRLFSQSHRINEFLLLCIIFSLLLCLTIYFCYVNFIDTLILTAYSLEFNNTPFPNNNSRTDIADYTLLVYMIGSDFEARKYSASKDIDEMKKVGIGSNINIVLQTGGGINEEKSSSVINFSKVQRHQIVNGTLKHLMDLELKNMAEPNTLSDFIKWGTSEFPAMKYAIVFWDHGSGIHGFGRDFNFNNDQLTPYELHRGFYNGINGSDARFELIGFDACLMSSLEIASKLHYFSPYMVASEEIEPEWGWNYTSILESVNSDPNQSGISLGKSIIDSYSNSSKGLSKSELFGTHKEITLSAVDMTKIPQLVKDLNSLSKALVQTISNLSSAISISKSIDLTEHYGQSALGSTGLVDLYDLSTNIKETHPELERYVEDVQNSINSTVIYSYKGDSRPNAKGISIYMPFLKHEYNDKAERQVVDIDWLNFLYTQRLMIGSDTLAPHIKSIREGNAITGNVYGSDIANVYAEIIINSSDVDNLDYVQNIDSSFIDGNGYFSYTDHKMLVLCNETQCIPTSMNLESNRDKKFVFIPMRLESYDGEINNNASLVYEVDKDNNFIFLGLNPETNPDETIPKGKIGLHRNDKIFLEARPAMAMTKQKSDISGKAFREISGYMNGGPLFVNDPKAIIPRYIDISSPFTVSFTICDYSDNCDKTRWYKINAAEQSNSILQKDDQLGYDVQPKENESNNSYNPKANNYTYINPTFGFKISYPSDWTRESQNIYDTLELTYNDPLVVEFIPSKYSELPGSGYRPGLSIGVTDWPFKETPEYLFKHINENESLNYTIVDAGFNTIAGNPAFTFIIEYTSEEEQFLGVANEKRKEMITSVLVNGRMYDLSFGSYKSQFDNYFPIVEDIINSFRPYHIQNQTDNNLERIANRTTSVMNDSNNTTQYEKEPTENKNITESLKWATYVDPKYGYSIKYPYNVGIGKPFSMESADPELIGNLFVVDNSTQETPEPKEAVQVIVKAFHKNETDKMSEFSMGKSLRPISHFNFTNLVSIAAEDLSIYEMLPNFKLLENSTTRFKDIIVYEIEFTYYNPQFRSIMQDKWIYLSNGEDLAIFEYSSNPQKYEQYFPVLQKMLDSFKFQN